MTEKPEPKVRHKLLLEYRCEPPDPVRGQPLKIKIRVTNIGEEVFPGGRIQSAVLKFRGILSETFREEVIIPEISSNKSSELEAIEFVALAEGIASIEVKIEANDNKPVEFFQNPEFSTGEIWLNFVYIRRKEDQIVISLLEKILKTLSKQKS